MAATPQGPDVSNIGKKIVEAYENLLVPAVFTGWAEQLVTDAKVRPGERVLDIGTGTGIVARIAQRATGPDGSVTGVDALPDMIAVAEANAPSITWMRGDAMDLPLPDESYDVALSQQVLQFVPDKRAALTHARRVLVDGGRIAVSVWGPLAHSPAVATLQEVVATHAPDMAGFLPLAFSLPDGDALRALLSEAGFEDVHVEVQRRTVTFASVAHFVETYLDATPIRAMLSGLPPHVLDTILRDARTQLDRYVDDGVFSFEQEANVGYGTR